MNRGTGVPLALALALLLGSPPAAAQDIEPAGEGLRDLFDEARACHGVRPGAEATVCQAFVARALFALHGVVDFGPRSGRFLTSAAIVAELPTHAAWTRVGTADDGGALEQACRAAERQQAIVAARDAFLVVVLPATCVRSGWGERVPRAAAYLGARPLEESFAGSPLSRVFRTGDRARVALWVRRPTRGERRRVSASCGRPSSPRVGRSSTSPPRGATSLSRRPTLAPIPPSP